MYLGPRRARRSAWPLGAAATALGLVLLVGGGSAYADPAVPLPVPVPAPAPSPAPPQDAASARQQLDTVQREAEVLTEQWHAATDELAARESEADQLREAAIPAQLAADQARADEEDYRRELDGVTLSIFDTGQLDQFSALLLSPTPQAYLDRLSTLETFTADRKVALDELRGKVDLAARRQAEADELTRAALEAADSARRAKDEIEVRKAEAERRIDEAERLLRRLDPQQIAERNGPAEGAPSVVLGSGLAVDALRAAATKLGRPYVWGASGPNSFDCSGLTSWAFKQVGIVLPRSSSAQATVGKPVRWEDLRPGDLVFYYSPVSHVGIYAGDGKMINAPQSGDVVKYQTVSKKAFSGARRI